MVKYFSLVLFLSKLGKLLKAKIVEKPKYAVVGPLKRFNQKHTVLSRTSWDPSFQRLKSKYQKTREERIRKENVIEDYALRDSSWYVANTLGTFAGFMHGNNGLYSWKSLEVSKENLDSEMKSRKKIRKPATVSEKIKSAGKFYGADLVGIARLNEFWVYSYSYNRSTEQNRPIRLPQRYEFAVVMAIEMEYDTFAMSDIGASAATGLGYSKMAFVSSLLAQFIRNIGYEALPCGNDTALSIPLAIDAGLGELGRNGLLITPDFGSRVRLCKVITNLPLKEDKPSSFGVQEYCEKCKKCLESCPVQAIREDKTAEAITTSNNSGVLKWPVNGEKCFRFWCETGIDCSVCIKVCPYSTKRKSG
ncbi:MAG: reductive dehalogenase [Candidatus Bathyarchaeota archaeon]|nr:MAG: reductive dehalogenase [Candidatus Bathyarchaeota archaeon]